MTAEADLTWSVRSVFQLEPLSLDQLRARAHGWPDTGHRPRGSEACQAGGKAASRGVDACDRNFSAQGVAHPSHFDRNGPNRET